MSLPDENKIKLINQIRESKQIQKPEQTAKDGKTDVTPATKTYTLEYYITKLRKNKVLSHSHSHFL
jgi:hypothetical protein